MGNHKIRLNIDVTDTEDNSNTASVNMELDMTDEEACSIDAIEKAMLRINYDAVRQAVSEHLTAISKKKPKTSKQEVEEELKRIIKNIVLMGK
jgi:hypothetical protein